MINNYNKSMCFAGWKMLNGTMGQWDAGRFVLLTNFHKPRPSEFGCAMKILYLCIVNEKG